MSYNSGSDSEAMLNCVGKRLTRTSADVPRDPKTLSPNLDRYNPPPPPRTQTTRLPTPSSSSDLQRTSSHQIDTTNSVKKTGPISTERLPSQQELRAALDVLQSLALISLFIAHTTSSRSCSFKKMIVSCRRGSVVYDPWSSKLDTQKNVGDRVPESSLAAADATSALPSLH
ncbi:unnamed protein product [Schistocephalus solidus]|uniref:Uncharacterized protein n=1 Tax=Schistocephalus solidus TaxID=70667 RepID=A0A183SRQ7_SCHSO|nr:unnamed protein product [Schistocephalus solidus]